MSRRLNLSTPQILILQLLVSFPVVLALAISPALPLIAERFEVSKEMTQLLISLYLIGFAIGHLLYGPLANRFGRKATLLFCLSVSIVSSLGCLLADALKSFFLLALFRTVMALGASGTLKLSYTIVADLNRGERLTRLVSFFIISFSIAPPAAIFLSGHLTEAGGAKSVFLFMLIYSALLLLSCLFLTETLSKPKVKALGARLILKNYWRFAKSPLLITGALILGCAVSLTYLFGCEAPFISQNLIGLKPAQFGALSIIPYGGMLLGGLYCSLVARSVAPHPLLMRGAWITIASSLIMTLLFSWHILSSASLFFPLIGIFFGIGLISASIVSVSMSHVQDKSYASAILNFITNGLSVIAALFIGPLTKLALLSFPLTLLTIGLIEAILIRTLKTRV